MSVAIEKPPPALAIDDLRDLLRSVSETTERLETTHTALQDQVARLQRELAEANAQLQRSRSLAALGEMAAGIAHEIRNPLGSIQLYVQVLAEELQGRPAESELCEKISRAVVGLDAIVRDVLSFARDTTLRMEETTAGDLFDRALGACEPLLAAAEIAVVREVEEECVFRADGGLLVQALANLVRNAVEAMSGCGEGERDPSDRALRLEAGRRSVRWVDGSMAECVVLCVEDAGPGIPPDVVERMFNPFFTTRKSGTGLGLAIVHRIVDAHGGRTRVDSAKARGARIEIALPLKSIDRNRADCSGLNGSTPSGVGAKAMEVRS